MRLKPLILLLLTVCAAAPADELAALVRDRSAIERVYYNHRLGQKPPFEQATPPALIERLVREDRRKEAALRQVYGVVITPGLLDAEVQRINTTTRAPDMLAEIKAALDNDPAKFAQAFAKPFLVERLLRDKFDNDEALHAPQRREAERVREQLLQAVAISMQSKTQFPLTLTLSPKEREQPSTARGKPLNGAPCPARTEMLRLPKGEGWGEGKASARLHHSGLVEELLTLMQTNTPGQFSETTWQLGPRPAATNAPAADELEIKQRFGPNAQLISSPHRVEREHYFEDLPDELQRVLRVQLRQAGDVSAVIETPGGFLLYVAREKTDTALSAACLSLPKRSYEDWLSQ